MAALTELQDRILRRFFARRSEFFLTGGAALLEKLHIDGVIVDAAQEILANKLCALLSRVETRDLVDVAKLEEAGHDAIAAVELARQKDGGMSATQLAWVLSAYPIAGDVASLYGMSPDALERYRDALIRRLTATAFPR